MRLNLDPRSPTPLYHQLSEAIRYRIATGAIAAGVCLPPLRQAAALWGVNLHTVRRAYGELERLGMVMTEGTHGTRVLPDQAGAELPGRRGTPGRARFVEEILLRARQEHGLGAQELIALLEAHRATRPPRGGTPRLHVIECSRTQCLDLAAQLEAHWDVKALPWPLDPASTPPEGPLVATWFHYNDLRRLLGARLAEVRFAAIVPDPALRDRLRHAARAPAGRISVLLCDRVESMARNIAADLSRILPESEFRLRTVIVKSPETWLARTRSRNSILFPPREWGRLSETARRDPRVHEVRYVFDPRDLDTIGLQAGWRAR
ncbi:MAG: GntR family transcriptional regulator [Candidatus Eisenbacteria bacterium]|nr:GntR family transcriptional regulator [Candidatus Eisenbacteria bacterium]